MPAPALGFMILREHRPEDVAALAARVEAAGFDEAWLVEDCFFAGGMAAVATALAATSRVRVGLGIMPAPVRNPAFTAMEVAALARMHPGRVVAGIGHGIADWMRQIGAKPESQLTLLEETVSAIRSLLAGEEVTTDGRYVRLDGVRLDHPPDEVPPVLVGVRRARSLALSGRVADGTLLSEPSAVPYIEWAREQIAATRRHRLTVYAWCSVDDDGRVARDALRPHVAARLLEGGPQVEQLGIAEDVSELMAAGGIDHLTTAMPDAWIASMAVAGTPEECAAAIRALGDAGAESVVLAPLSTEVDPEDVGRRLVPLLHG